MSAVKAAKPTVWQAFLQPSAWTMFFFGFASGLPFLLVAGTLAYWLKEDGIRLKDITMIASAGMMYSLKFLWAPLVDRLRLPWLGRLGQRRSWLLLAQVLVMVGLLAMASITPGRLEPGPPRSLPQPELLRAAAPPSPSRMSLSPVCR